jgi:hypothetical protein
MTERRSKLWTGEERMSENKKPSEETCEQRNMRIGWGCPCHGMTFCRDLKFSHYEDDVPVFDPVAKGKGD